MTDKIIREFAIDGLPLSSFGLKTLITTPPIAPAQRRQSNLEVYSHPGVISAPGAANVRTIRIMVEAESAPNLPLEESISALWVTLDSAETVTFTVGELSLTSEVVDATVSEPRRLTVNVWAFEIVLLVQPYSYEDDTLIAEPVAPSTSVLFPEWAGSTAPTLDAVIRLTGPLTAAGIYDMPASNTARRGVSLTYNLGPRGFLFFEPGNFRAWVGESYQWLGPDENSPRPVLDYPTGGPLTLLRPSAEGIKLSMTGQGFNHTAPNRTEVTVRGKRWHL